MTNRFPSSGAEIPLHTVFLLPEAIFGLFHVCAYRILRKESFRLYLVEFGSSSDERSSKMLLVDIEIGLGCVSLIQA